MNQKFSNIKAPQFLWGFAFIAVFCLVSSLIVGCNDKKIEQTVISKQRYEFSYNKETFEVTETIKDDYEVKLTKSNTNDQFQCFITVFAPTKIDEKQSFEQYYETARLDFLSTFDKVLNEKDSKTELKGITTYTNVISAIRESTNQTWTGMLKLSIVNDGLLIAKITGPSMLVEHFRSDINNLFDSIKLKGKDD
jgi:hypothetical protein